MIKFYLVFAVTMLALSSLLRAELIFFEDFEGFGGNLESKHEWVLNPVASAFKVAPQESQFAGIVVALYFEQEPGGDLPSFQPYLTSTDTFGIGNHYPTTSGVGITDFLAKVEAEIEQGVTYELKFDYFMRPDSENGQAFTVQIVDFDNPDDVLAVRSFEAPSVAGEIMRPKITYTGAAEHVGKRLGIRILAPAYSNMEVTGFDNVALTARSMSQPVGIPERRSSALLLGVISLCWVLVWRR